MLLQLLADFIDGDAPVIVGSFGAVQASSRGQPMLDMEPAILQIPDPSPAGLLELESPEANETFLHQIFTQSDILRQSSNDFLQRPTDLALLNQWPRFGVPVGLGPPGGAQRLGQSGCISPQESER